MTQMIEAACEPPGSAGRRPASPGSRAWRRGCGRAARAPGEEQRRAWFLRARGPAAPGSLLPWNRSQAIEDRRVSGPAFDNSDDRGRLRARGARAAVAASPGSRAWRRGCGRAARAPGEEQRRAWFLRVRGPAAPGSLLPWNRSQAIEDRRVSGPAFDNSHDRGRLRAPWERGPPARAAPDRAGRPRSRRGRLRARGARAAVAASPGSRAGRRGCGRAARAPGEEQRRAWFLRVRAPATGVKTPRQGCAAPGRRTRRCARRRAALPGRCRPWPCSLGHVAGSVARRRGSRARCMAGARQGGRCRSR